MLETIIATAMAASIALGAATTNVTPPVDEFSQAVEVAQHPETTFDTEPFAIHDFSAIATPIVYGVSGDGRPVVADELGSGNNHLILTFAVHGWEDVYPASGRDLVRLGEMTVAYCSLHPELLESGDWTVYVIPCCNPDGVLSGYTDYGPGRCTTTQFAADGCTIVSGGVDINRSFVNLYGTNPTFISQYGGRYNNGGHPNWCSESQGLKDFLDSHVSPTGKNIYVDTHGYYGQILLDSSNYYLYSAFENAFHFGRGAYGMGAGYVANYAHDFLYMDSCLLELPANCYYDGAVFDYGHDQKYLRAITDILTNYPK